jgi:hypothetical protein
MFFCYVVDEMPVDRPNYHAKLRLIQRFCEILAIRMETFTEAIVGLHNSVANTNGIRQRIS